MKDIKDLKEMYQARFFNRLNLVLLDWKKYPTNHKCTVTCNDCHKVFNIYLSTARYHENKKPKTMCPDCKKKEEIQRTLDYFTSMGKEVISTPEEILKTDQVKFKEVKLLSYHTVRLSTYNNKAEIKRSLKWA